MAYVRIYYHREPKRLAPHVRYIARRPESDGLRGLGTAFRELRGDVDASVRLLQQHAARARVRAGNTTREGPFVRLLFTLPTELAARVSEADARLTDGARLVLRDAVEATFRSVGRQLQGVYAVHFHAAQRAAHGHVHVDLSPLDTLGRPTFVTKDQRERFRSVWEREVVKALERVERRGRAVQEKTRAVDHDPARASDVRAAQPADGQGHVSNARPGHEPVGAGASTATPWPTVAPTDRRAVRRPFAPRRQHLRYVPVLTEWLFGRSRTPLTDLFVRALVARTERRLGRSMPTLAVRFALGLPVPRVTVRLTTPLVQPRLLRLPYWS